MNDTHDMNDTNDTSQEHSTVDTSLLTSTYASAAGRCACAGTQIEDLKDVTSMKQAFIHDLHEQLTAYHIALTDYALECCADHFVEMCQANTITNLTRITSLHNAVVLHYVDSLLLVPVYLKYVSDHIQVDVKQKNAASWGLDMGTGAGFPGIPLSLALTKNFILCDSVNKKVSFLQKFINTHQLSHQLEAIHTRLEELPQSNDHAIDLVVARAVSELGVLIEYASPLLQQDGLLICSKAHLRSEEIEYSKRAAQICGFSFVSRETFELPELMGHREFVVLKKTHAAQIKLPRKIGDALHKPL